MRAEFHIFLPRSGKPHPIITITKKAPIIESVGWICKLLFPDMENIAVLRRRSPIANTLILSRPCIVEVRDYDKRGLRRVVHNLPIEKGVYDHYLQVVKHVQFRLSDDVTLDEIENMYYRLDADYYVTWLVGDHVVEAMFLRKVNGNVNESETLYVETNVVLDRLSFIPCLDSIEYVDLDCIVDIDSIGTIFNRCRIGNYRFFADTFLLKTNIEKITYLLLIGRTRYMENIVTGHVVKFHEDKNVTILKLSHDKEKRRR